VENFYGTLYSQDVVIGERETIQPIDTAWRGELRGECNAVD